MQLKSNLSEINNMLNYWEGVEKLATENVHIFTSMNTQPKNLDSYGMFDTSIENKIAEVLVFTAILPLALFARKGMHEMEMEKFCNDTIQIIKNDLDTTIKQVQMAIYNNQITDVSMIGKTVMTKFFALSNIKKTN